MSVGGPDAADAHQARRQVKCVVWDLDNTLLAGTLLESEQPPPPDAAMAAVVAQLESRGILNSVASRNPPGAARPGVLDALGPSGFVAPQLGWGRKSDAVRRIADELSFGLDAMTFVDDDPYERAEVAMALPDVLVLSPEDVAEALDWPEFSPAMVTVEGRRRAQMYAERQRRQEAAHSFASREEFLRHCAIEVRLSTATAGEVPRLHELSVRTHQFNSAGNDISASTFAELVDSPAHLVVGVHVRDRFGDDGLVGGVVVSTGGPAWQVEMLMMSCRAMGRGIIEVVLAWLQRAATAAEAGEVAVGCKVDERNVPLRLALSAAGFRADAERASAGGRAVFRLPLTSAAAHYPDWVEVSAEVP